MSTTPYTRRLELAQRARYRAPQHPPDLDAARGIVIGAVLGCLLWTLVITAVVGWLG